MALIVHEWVFFTGGGEGGAWSVLLAGKSVLWRIGVVCAGASQRGPLMSPQS